MGRALQPVPSGIPAARSCERRRPEETTLYQVVRGLVLDGVYRRTGGEPGFQAARAPTRAGLADLLDRIIARLMNMLTRRGYLVAEQGMSYLADLDADDPLRSLQAASCTYRIAPGPHALQAHRDVDALAEDVLAVNRDVATSRLRAAIWPRYCQGRAAAR